MMAIFIIQIFWVVVNGETVFEFSLNLIQKSKCPSVKLVFFNAKKSVSKDDSNVTNISNLTIAELGSAGEKSEYATRGDDDAHIKCGLLALEQIFISIVEGKERYLCHRNSTVTRCLKRSMTQTAKIGVIYTISPNDRDAKFTFQTLR